MFNLSKHKSKAKAVPQVLVQEEDPVNYKSVLDYLVGLSLTEYNKILKVSGIYRNANKEAAKVLGVADKPTAVLKQEKPTDAEVDAALDEALGSESLTLIDEEAPEAPKPDKEQAPSNEKKIDVNEA